MKLRQRMKVFVQKNITLLTLIPMIIGIHWSWLKLQDNPNLVDPKDRKGLPYGKMIHMASEKLFGQKTNKSDEKTT